MRILRIMTAAILAAILFLGGLAAPTWAQGPDTPPAGTLPAMEEDPAPPATPALPPVAAKEAPAVTPPTPTPTPLVTTHRVAPRPNPVLAEVTTAVQPTEPTTPGLGEQLRQRLNGRLVGTDRFGNFRVEGAGDLDIVAAYLVNKGWAKVTNNTITVSGSLTNNQALEAIGRSTRVLRKVARDNIETNRRQGKALADHDRRIGTVEQTVDRFGNRLDAVETTVQELDKGLQGVGRRITATEDQLEEQRGWFWNHTRWLIGLGLVALAGLAVALWGRRDINRLQQPAGPAAPGGAPPAAPPAGPAGPPAPGQPVI